MKFKIILYFSIIFLLASCDAPIESDSLTSESNSSTISTSESISNKTSSSSYSEGDSSTKKDSSLVNELFETIVIDYLDVPSSINGQYASEGIYKENDISLYCYNIMQNTGKFANLGYNTIQMKKEGSYLANIDAIRGVLSITMMKIGYYDYSINEQVNSTIVPTVSATPATIEITEILHGEITKEDENTITYTFNDSIKYVFFSIQNDSSYAQYLLNITWEPL